MRVTIQLDDERDTREAIYTALAAASVAFVMVVGESVLAAEHIEQLGRLIDAVKPEDERGES